ncbi:MAG: SRPBCC domain-containing protein [Pyrinomonadaceae bacterium]|nr:SRPBCC domain-containing protein [Pyrinomonadaceae bacterium]
MATTTKPQSPRMSDEAVKAKTGKNWDQWFAILDKAGAKKMSHPDIVKILSSKYEVGPWWRQMVTASYEHARGMRDRHEKPAGYEISVSRTVGVPLATLYKAVANAKSRSRWLSADELEVRKATANKSLRVTWKDGKTSLEISFYPKGDGKSQVVVQHGKLPDAKAAAKMKTFWSNALDQLRETLK